MVVTCLLSWELYVRNLWARAMMGSARAGSNTIQS